MVRNGIEYSVSTPPVKLVNYFAMPDKQVRTDEELRTEVQYLVNNYQDLSRRVSRLEARLSRNTRRLSLLGFLIGVIGIVTSSYVLVTSISNYISN